MPEAQIRMYGTVWCPDCQRARYTMSEHNIPYIWFDIDQDNEARAFVEKVNRGKRSVPTIVFPDDSALVEPSNAELEEKLATLRTTSS